MSELIPIQTIGTFFKMNPQGFIINPTSHHHISPKWRQLIDKVQATIIEELGGDLHSLYLRGSVARGLAKDGIADLDLFVLVHQPGLRWKAANWLPKYQKKWQSDFPFVKEVEVMCTSFSENFFQSNPRLAMLIKTQSLLLAGSEIASSIPDFKPGIEMMLNYRWFKKDLFQFLENQTPNKNEIQEMSKVMLRTGFEIVMKRVGKYTTDLYPALHSFSRYYPDKARQMETVLYYYLNPGEPLDTLIGILQELGPWMVKEIEEHI